MASRAVLLGLFCFHALLLGVAGTVQPIHPQRKDVDNILESLTSSQHDEDGQFSRLFSLLGNIDSRAAPHSISEVVSRLASIHARSNATGYVRMTAELIAEGLATKHIESIPQGLKRVNNAQNVNKREPSQIIYPKKIRQDAPYLQSEAAMRRQILIPSGFTYGEKPPVILVPGTGERGGNSFQHNYIKLLSGRDNADIVWINPPGYELADAQTNSETVAYAINYISGISKNRNVTTISWSQGTVNVQWAVKYWPSTRSLVSASIAHSGDYYGTVVANLIDPLNAVPLPPSILQQEYNSTFTQVLRSNGGDSAYVPTTNIYSGFFDEVVEPQQRKRASGYLKDARGVGVTNVDITHTCPRDSPAGLFADHESVLYNSLTHALANDVLKHGGNAKLSRIDLKDACSRPAALGLSLQDVLGTEATIPFAVVQIGLYMPKVTKEPEIRKYAI